MNKQPRHDPEFPVRIGVDRLHVEHNLVAAAERVYLALNKPRGVIVTAADEKGRGTVYDLLPKELPWISPVGRLDQASEGLLLLTNDSEWAARVTDPESHLPKTYHVQIAALPSEDLVSRLREGIRDKGELLRAVRVERLRSGSKNGWLTIVLEEGKNRQIRRMLAGRNVEVMRLIRVAIGPLQLGSLAKGRSRLISAVEKQELDLAMNRQASQRE